MLSGAGLTVTGVAEAVSVPGVSPNQSFVDVPQSTDSASDPASTAPGGAASDPAAGPTDTDTAGAPPSGGAGDSAPPPSTPPTASGTPSGGTPSATASATGSATAGAPATGATASATAAPTTAGGAPTAPVTQPQPRQTLAETGTDQSTPWLLSGSATLIAGGLVFRFGPRRTPRRSH